VQQDQPPVKKDRQQPDGQRQDKKKAEDTAMNARNRMEISRLVIDGRWLKMVPVQ
jgi:hypothetical protein